MFDLPTPLWEWHYWEATAPGVSLSKVTHRLAVSQRVSPSPATQAWPESSCHFSALRKSQAAC